jgi:tyrosyl-tRNA synthetase
MNFTVNQMSQRDNFAARLASDKPVGLHEFLYPLLQGMDSVSVKADVELGGNDQYFNLLAGRTLQKKYGQKPQDIMTFDLLEGTDGRKMSKTYHNAIYLLDSPAEKFGKVMSIKDELISRYFEMATEIPLTEIKRIEKVKDPRKAKAKLAYEIVKRYHGEKIARDAANSFEKQFVRNEAPADMPIVKLKKATMFLTDILVDSKLASSKSEARRLIEQGGVRVDGAVLGEREAVVEPHSGMIIQVGKRKFVKVK